MDIAIREAEPRDIENLVVLKQQVWIATYAVGGIRTEFSGYVLSTFVKKNVKSTLLDNDCLTLVAEQNNHLIGCIEIQLHPENAIPEVKGSPEITVVYVLERFCGMGVGQELLEHAFDVLKKKSYTSAWLSVLYSNARALKFYSRNHFKDVGKLYFEMDGNKYENRVLLKVFG